MAVPCICSATSHLNKNQYHAMWLLGQLAFWGRGKASSTGERREQYFIYIDLRAVEIFETTQKERMLNWVSMWITQTTWKRSRQREMKKDDRREKEKSEGTLAPDPEKRPSAPKYHTGANSSQKPCDKLYYCWGHTAKCREDSVCMLWFNRNNDKINQDAELGSYQ